MGLITDFGSRTVLHRTSRMWGESTALVLALGLSAGCSSRPAAPLADPLPAISQVNVASPTVDRGAPARLTPGEVTSTSSANGHTHLHLAPLPELQEGDLVHVLADERVVATALITGIDASSATALVTGLTDRTRAVTVGDVAARLATKEILPTTAALTAPPAEATSVEVTALAVAQSAPAPSEHAPKAVVVAAAAPAPEPDPSTASLTPEVRARLAAERAYFDLATRVLRLPAAGPELTELQARLRTELAALELLP